MARVGLCPRGGVTTLIGSMMMDRFDRKTVLMTMYGGFGISTLFCGFAWNFESLLVARTAAGMCGGLAAVTIMAMIGDLFPPEKRGRAVGAITSAFAVASIVGIPMGLLLTEWYGRGASFIALGGLSAAVWIVALARLPSVRDHLKHERRHPLHEFAAVVKEGNHQRAFVFSFFLVLGTFTVGSFTAPYLSATNGWSEGDLTILYSVGGVCTLLGMSAVGRLADRYHRLPLFRVLGGITIITTLVMATLPPCPIWVATIALSAFMVFSAGRIVPAQAMLLGTAEPRCRGAFMSLNTAVQHLGTALAPLLAAAFITQVDGKFQGFWMVGLFAAGCAVVSLILAGTLRSAPTTNVSQLEAEKKAPPEALAESSSDATAALLKRNPAARIPVR